MLWGKAPLCAAFALLAACGSANSSEQEVSSYDSLEAWCDATDVGPLPALSVPGVEGEDNESFDQAKRAALDEYVEAYSRLGLPSSAVPKEATDALADYASEFEKLRHEVNDGADLQELLKEAYANPGEGLFAAGARADEAIIQTCGGT